MKKLLLFSISCMLTMGAFAQSHLQWTTYEATPNSEINDFKGMGTDKSGHTYFIDFTQSNIDFWVTYRFFCYDANGVKLWQYDNDSCFTGCEEKYSEVIPLDDSGAIFVGYYDDSVGDPQLRLKRIDMSGHLVWEKFWTGAFQLVTPITSKLDNDGNIVVALDMIQTVATSDDYAVAKFNRATGENMWHVTLPTDGTPIHVTEKIADMVIGADNSIYACGIRQADDSGTSKSQLFKLTSAGAISYKVLTSMADSGMNTHIILDASGNLYLTGTVFGDAYLEAHSAATGDALWNTRIQNDTASAVIPIGMALDEANNIYTLSNYNTIVLDTTIFVDSVDDTLAFIDTVVNSSTATNYMVGKYTAAGSLLWSNSYFAGWGENITTGGAVQITACNNAMYILASTSDSTHSLLLLSKLDTMGNIVWFDSTNEDYVVGAFGVDNDCNVYVSRAGRLGHPAIVNVTQKFSDMVTAVPHVTANNQVSVYPNPADNLVNIRYPNITDASSQAFIYDINGRLVNKIMLTGTGTFVSTTSLPAGMYVCKLTVNGNTTMHKILVQHN